MAPDPDAPDGSDSLRGYERAREAADAERTLTEQEAGGDDDEKRAARQADVSAAEGAWHDRRHEAYTASQERDRAREELDGDDGG